MGPVVFEVCVLMVQEMLRFVLEILVVRLIGLTVAERVVLDGDTTERYCRGESLQMLWSEFGQRCGEIGSRY